jgi:branched-subunit amino acid transport protein
MSLWLVAVLAGAGTLALRLSFLLAGRYLRLPSWTRRTSDLIFPVAIAAILGAGLRTTVATDVPADLLALAVAAVATVLVSRRTGSILAALGAGLAVVAVASFVASLAGW